MLDKTHEQKIAKPRWVKLSDSMYELSGTSAYVVRSGTILTGFKFWAMLEGKPVKQHEVPFSGRTGLSKAKAFAASLLEDNAEPYFSGGGPK